MRAAARRRTAWPRSEPPYQRGAELGLAAAHAAAQLQIDGMSEWKVVEVGGPQRIERRHGVVHPQRDLEHARLTEAVLRGFAQAAIGLEREARVAAREPCAIGEVRSERLVERLPVGRPQLLEQRRGAAA